jgi:hypothetical protein
MDTDKNPKHQNPNPKKIPSAKIQAPGKHQTSNFKSRIAPMNAKFLQRASYNADFVQEMERQNEGRKSDNPYKEHDHEPFQSASVNLGRVGVDLTKGSNLC